MAPGPLPATPAHLIPHLLLLTINLSTCKTCFCKLNATQPAVVVILSKLILIHSNLFLDSEPDQRQTLSPYTFIRQIKLEPASFSEEKYALYARYQAEVRCRLFDLNIFNTPHCSHSPTSTLRARSTKNNPRKSPVPVSKRSSVIIRSRSLPRHQLGQATEATMLPTSSTTSSSLSPSSIYSPKASALCTFSGSHPSPTSRLGKSRCCVSSPGFALGEITPFLSRCFSITSLVGLAYFLQSSCAYQC